MSMKAQNIISLIVIVLVALIVLNDLPRGYLIAMIFFMAIALMANGHMARQTDQRLRDAGIDPLEFHSRPLSREVPFF